MLGALLQRQGKIIQIIKFLIICIFIYVFVGESKTNNLLYFSQIILQTIDVDAIDVFDRIVLLSASTLETFDCRLYYVYFFH